MIMYTLIPGLLWMSCFACNPRPQSGDALKQEFIRFAEQSSMVIGDDYSGLQDFRRQALMRAEALRSISFQNPQLRAAAAEVVQLAQAYDFCQKLRTGSSWTMEEQVKAFGKLRRGNEAEGLANALQQTGKKVAEFHASRELTIVASIFHSRVWQDVIPMAKALGGPDKGTLPLRFQVASVLNTYGKPLNNLTVILETNISLLLPEGARTHVIFLKRLEPDEFFYLPTWLFDKQWNEKSQLYEPGGHCFRCTILSDEVTCEAVDFDLKLPKIKSPWVAEKGALFFPDDSFVGRGKYDPKTPIQPTGPDLFVVGSVWIGTSKQRIPLGDMPEFKMVVTERNGERFKAATTYRREDHTGEVEGTIRNGVVRWAGRSKERSPRDGRGLPTEGAILGSRVVGNYRGNAAAPVRGKAQKQEGGISLWLRKEN